MCLFVPYSKGKTPRRPGPKKASNIDKDPVGVSEHLTLEFKYASCFPFSGTFAVKLDFYFANLELP